MTAFQPTAGSVLLSSRSARRGHSGGRVREGLLALGVYLVLALVLIGRLAASHPASGTLGTGPDVQIFEWGLRWWPYAIGHGLDPFRSARVWPPAGGAVLWSTTVPLLSVVATPLTLLAGAPATWNLLVVLAPATAAWAAWTLCAELDATPPAALLGGAMFGFGSYELCQDIAHLQLTACLLVPLAARVAVRGVHQGTPPGAIAAATAAIVIGQFLIAPEILGTMIVMGILWLVASVWTASDTRIETLLVARAMVAGALAAAVVLSPLLVIMFERVPPHSSGAVAYPADLLNLVVPTARTEVGGSSAASVSAHFPGNAAEQGAYLGIPVLLIALAAVRGARSDRGRRPALVMLAVAIVLSLGARLTVDGHSTIWMPWAIATHLPFLRNAIPVRLSLYASLAASVVVATWCSDARIALRVRWLAVALIVVSLAPADWIDQPVRAAARSATVHRALAGGRVLSLPFFDAHERGLAVQQADDMDFGLIDGWMQIRPRGFAPGLPGTALTAPALARLHGASATRFVAELRAAGITRLLLWEPTDRLISGLHLSTVRAGGVVIARVR